MKNLSIFILLVIIVGVIENTSYSAQNWAKTYGIDKGEVYSIQQTAGGGYIVAGTSAPSSAGSERDACVVKLHGDGSIDWANTYGGSDNDCAYSIQELSGGGYVFAGNYGKYLWVVKLEGDGDISWQKKFGSGFLQDAAYTIQETSDEGFIVAGYTNIYGSDPPNVWVLKLNNDGDPSWQRAYGSSGEEYAFAVQECFNNDESDGYIVAGYTTSYVAGDSGSDFWVLRLEDDGVVSWGKNYGETDSEVAYDIKQTSDSGFVVAGYTESYGAGIINAYVIKLEYNGVISWQKAYGGTDLDCIYSIQELSGGGYIATGYTKSFGEGNADIWLLELNSNGTVSWGKTYGDNDEDIAWSVDTTSSGYALAGYTNSYGEGAFDFYVSYVDSNGNIADLIYFTSTCNVNCNVGTSNETVTDTDCVIYPHDGSVFYPGDGPSPTSVTATSTSTEIETICTSDCDADGVENDEDNCPHYPNGPNLGSCTKVGTGQNIGDECEEDSDCGTGGFCSMEQEDNDLDDLGDVCDNCPNNYNPGQEDIYPPGGNNCGDACECEGDFDRDGSIGGSDVDLFKTDIGRNQWDRPCSVCQGGPTPGEFCQTDPDCGEGGECAPDPLDPCYADFDCDGSVDGSDVDLFKTDMGRNQWDRPCPPCSGYTCSY